MSLETNRVDQRKEGLAEEAEAPSDAARLAEEKPQMNTPSLHYEVPGLRVVDSFFQLVDRLIICQLKYYHFCRDPDKAAEAAVARAQAAELVDASSLYLAECVSGRREPRVNQVLRFHEHDVMPAGRLRVPDHEHECLGAIISELTSCHARYWEAQGEIMALRKRLSGAGSTGYEDAYRELHEWQLVCDGCNQRRSALVNTGDQMLYDLFRDACR